MTTALVQTGVQFPDGSVQTTAASGSQSGVPAGVILLWSGAAANIPAGFVLCDGSNGTPNLTDRFIIGAGGSYAPTVSGGSTSITNANLPAHTHNYSGTSGGQSNDHAHGFSGSTGGQSNGHTHGVSDPGHSHGVAAGAGTQQPWSSDLQAGSSFGASTSAASGTGISIGANQQDHSHGFSGSTAGVNAGHTHAYSGTTDGGSGSSSAYLPPYFALCYIMKT